MKHIIILICTWLMVVSCEHTHEHSETMKEVITMNSKMWTDLNGLKSEVNMKIKTALIVDVEMDSLAKADLSKELKNLTAQKARLKQLDALIPELKGYEPKCSHEPGEPHTHNTVDVAGIPEEELLELHKELQTELNKVKTALK